MAPRPAHRHRDPRVAHRREAHPEPALKASIQTLLERLYRQAKADRWRLPQTAFLYALETSCRKAFAGREPGSRELSRYLFSLHLEDLSLACACAEGHAAAWDHFVLQMRPVLYHAADALDPSGGARELADSLYADLYGVNDQGEPRQSLLRYFHGRSSLGTWLRAVLAQRHVDRLRVHRRMEPLSDEVHEGIAPGVVADPDCRHLIGVLRPSFERALRALEPRERLRLACYYAQELTLAETGRVLHEHEATVSRQLARTRARLRESITTDLQALGLIDAQIARCFECATEQETGINLDRILRDGSPPDPQVTPAGVARKLPLKRSI